MAGGWRWWLVGMSQGFDARRIFDSAPSKKTNQTEHGYSHSSRLAQRKTKIKSAYDVAGYRTQVSPIPGRMLLSTELSRHQAIYSLQNRLTELCKSVCAQFVLCAKVLG